MVTSPLFPYSEEKTISMIRIETHVFNSFQVNTYVVLDENKQCLVVDPAFYTADEISAFDRYIDANGLKIIGQMNTHGHVDHVLGVLHLKSTYNCPFRAHPNEAGLVKNAPLMGDVFGLSVEPIPGIDENLQDLEKIPLGAYTLEAILVPGHSPGSLAFYSVEGKFVITGDALFQQSIGRTDLPGGDYDTLIHSIRTRLLSLPPETIVYPGHGAPTTIAEEASGNPFLTMTE
jgi:glyoxylase-like metal-dependent hydrolase (beta-lactamase superfamily II)